MTARRPLSEDALLQAVTDTMVAFHERYYHRVPLQARSRLMGDDLVGCTLGGIYTGIEQTLIETQRGSLVKDARNAFQNTMAPKLIREVQQRSGRRVVSFSSHSHVGPDVEIELFWFAEPL